MKRRCR